MDYDTDLAACAATDLAAQLLGQLDRARARQRAVELQLSRWSDRQVGGEDDIPALLVEQLRTHRCEVAALEQVLADFCGAEDCHVACA